MTQREALEKVFQMASSSRGVRPVDETVTYAYDYETKCLAAVEEMLVFLED